jgi:hypothetical protein
MRFYHDAEFHEDGQTIDLISYAILAEDGASFSAVNADADWDRISNHPWLPANVLPHLPGSWWCVQDGPDQGGRFWRPDGNDPRVMSHAEIAEGLTAFISGYGTDRDDHELWAWYGAYDHVVMAQLFGPMIQLPACVPMHTNDLKTLVGKRPIPPSLRNGEHEHDALADAHFDRRVYHWITGRLARLEAPRQLLALDAVWQDLSIQARADVRRLTAGTMLSELLDAAQAILRADGG